jgi:hypothetical protein
MLTININISILGAETDKTKVTFTMDTTGQKAETQKAETQTVVEGNVVDTQTIDAMDIDQPPLVYNFPVSMDIEFGHVEAMQIFPVQMEIDHSLKFNQNTLIRSTSCTI